MPSQGIPGWVDDQFESFKDRTRMSASANAESVADRLVVSAGSGRWQNWSAAVDEFQDSPVAGTGAGDYVFYWQQRRDVNLTVVNAHSLYLEVLGETGIVGLVLVLLPLGAAGIAYTRWRPTAGDAAGPVTLALGGAGVVALHAAGDWDWQLPAIVLPAVALGAGALKVMSPGRDGVHAAAVRWGIAAAAILAIVMVAGPTLSGTALSDARDSASRGDLAIALSRARDAARLAPQDPAPRLLEANLLTDLGRPAAADRPRSPTPRRGPPGTGRSSRGLGGGARRPGRRRGGADRRRAGPDAEPARAPAALHPGGPRWMTALPTSGSRSPTNGS